MKCSESWLREWVNPKITLEKLCSDLTMAGLEVEGYDNQVIEIAITPNRGDCLSVLGLAREVSALTKTPLKAPIINFIKPINKDTLPIHIKNKSGCARYVGRIIRGVKANAETPEWLKERLLSSGVNTISPIVDVTNYVMLELGQPMHAFDLNQIEKEVNVRLSKKGETISLLDGTKKELDEETLVIADKEKPVAIAGVMGGLDSSVTLLTQDILLESACFSQHVIARSRQYYNINSDSAYRFERGIDPTIQRQAIERATQLILDMSGGVPGPVMEASSSTHLPKKKIISLSADKIRQVLGVTIPTRDIEAIFKALQFEFKSAKNKWTVHVPLYRTDVLIPEDLIEEIARLYGYHKIPTQTLHAALQTINVPDSAPDLRLLRQAMSDQGYQEIITYSFVDKKLQECLHPDVVPHELLNPISADMAVMRTNLWPGLVNTFIYNQSRQQNRLRLFEIGTCFVSHHHKMEQLPKLAGLISGFCFKEQWGITSRQVDFYDLKGDLENILALSHPLNEYLFKPETHQALHPGQSAGIYHGSHKIGLLGALHPQILKTLGLSDQIFIFELDLNSLLSASMNNFQDISKFPEIRRDIAILINQAVPSKDIQDTIKNIAGSWLKDVFIFDVYQGKGISPGQKSVALALILQHPTRTLVDDEITDLMNKVIAALKGQLGAELRS